MEKKRHTLARAIAFVAGFAALFCLLGLTAGTLGAALSRYRRAVDLLCGAFVIVFGLAYLDVIPLPFFRGVQRAGTEGLWGAFLFGTIYAVGLTPCVGAFLGSALMLAASVGGAWKGFTLLLAYSLGLGVPFVLSAVLIDRLGGAFSWVKAHYRVLNMICGIFLILMGAAMATGLLNRLLGAAA
jgi:cytochrome c-type biogenesis protein